MALSLLIVEGIPATGSSLSELLANRFDTVRTVRSASEAFHAAVDMRPDLVITPFPAVTADGDLLTTVLKRDPRTSACTVLAFSDWCWAKTRAKALAHGCEAFVSAAAPVEDLLAAVDRLVDGRAAPGSNGSSAGPGPGDGAKARVGSPSPS